MPRTFLVIPARLLPNSVVILAGAALLGSIAIWFASHAPSGFEWTLAGPGYGKFIVCSRDGRMVVGLDDETPDEPFIRWNRRRPTGIWPLVNDDSLYLLADAWTWGFAAPHWAIALVLCVPIAWRWLAWRDHAEQIRRHEHGLCRHCGYDLRASVERCPECGEPIGAAAAAAAAREVSG